MVYYLINIIIILYICPLFFEKNEWLYILPIKTLPLWEYMVIQRFTAVSSERRTFMKSCLSMHRQMLGPSKNATECPSDYLNLCDAHINENRLSCNRIAVPEKLQATRLSGISCYGLLSFMMFSGLDLFRTAGGYRIHPGHEKLKYCSAVTLRHWVRIVTFCRPCSVKCHTVTRILFLAGRGRLEKRIFEYDLSKRHSGWLSKWRIWRDKHQKPIF